VDLGKLFKDAWELFVKDIGQLIVGMLLAAVIPGVAGGAVLVLAVLLAMPGMVSSSEQGGFTALSAVSIAVLVLGYFAVFAVMLLVAVPLYAGVLTGELRRVREGRTLGFWDAFSGFRVFRGVVWTYALAYLLVPLALLVVPIAVIVLGGVLISWPLIAGGIVLVVAVSVGLVYLSVCWIYAIVVVVDRGVGARDALRETRALVHGTGWWWTFLALFLLQLVMMGVYLVAGVLPVVGGAAGLLIAPYGLTFLVAMYFQARREDWLIGAALSAAAPPPRPAASSGPPTATWPAPPEPPEPPEGADRV